MITYIVYSHTDYSDILNVHSDYLKFENTILFINSNNLKLEEIYSKYKKIVFYDERLSYPQRVSYCLTQIEEEYFLFTHDIDIPIVIDVSKINRIYDYQLKNNIDRIDLQQDIRIGKQQINSQILEIEKFQEISLIDINEFDISLVRNDDIKNYMYNVNPSLWKKRTLFEILISFQFESYRTIEGSHVQFFCQKYKIFKLNSNNRMSSGYFTITPIYQFLHITHGGGLMPADKKINGADDTICEEYSKILSTYTFNRPLMTNMF